MTYKLDKIDARILYELDKDCRISDTQLGKKVGRSKETIRYRIKKLEEDNILLGFTTWIDPVRLGYRIYKVYFRLANNTERKQALIEEAKKDHRLFWLGVAEGAWNLGCTYFAKDNEEFFKLKNSLFSKYTDIIREVHTSSVVSVHIHEKTFLCKETPSWTTLFHKEETHRLDALSKKILKELYYHGRTSISTIAYKHNTTVDKVKHRIKKMKEQKIIVRNVALQNFEKLGYEFYKTFLQFNSLDEKTLQTFMETLLHTPQTIHMVKMIADWDVELEIMCKSFQEYNTIINTLTKTFPTITKVETAIMSEDFVFPSERLVFE